MTDRTIRAKIIDILQTDDCGENARNAMSAKCLVAPLITIIAARQRRIMSLFKKRDGSTEAAK